VLKFALSAVNPGVAAGNFSSRSDQLFPHAQRYGELLLRSRGNTDSPAGGRRNKPADDAPLQLSLQFRAGSFVPKSLAEHSTAIITDRFQVKKPRRRKRGRLYFAMNKDIQQCPESLRLICVDNGARFGAAPRIGFPVMVPHRIRRVEFFRALSPKSHPVVRSKAAYCPPQSPI
jgi:hypothetical protein